MEKVSTFSYLGTIMASSLMTQPGTDVKRRLAKEQSWLKTRQRSENTASKAE